MIFPCLTTSMLLTATASLSMSSTASFKRSPSIPTLSGDTVSHEKASGPLSGSACGGSPCRLPHPAAASPDNPVQAAVDECASLPP